MGQITKGITYTLLLRIIMLLQYTDVHSESSASEDFCLTGAI